MIWFDNNATTQMLPIAKNAWEIANLDFWQNPSSPSRAGAKAFAYLEGKRELLASLLSVSPKQIVFNSGATEGNNSIIQYEALNNPRKRILVSSGEHPSVVESALYNWGNRLTWIPLTKNGCVDMDFLSDELKKGDVAMVSIMAANNETGVLQPCSEAASLAKMAGAKFHSDATQWIGKVNASGFDEFDYWTACAHKFGGPKGVGFIILGNPDASFTGQKGGGQENRHRSGTENIPSIAAMVAALEECSNHFLKIQNNQMIRDKFIRDVERFIPGVEVVGEKAARLWNTVFLIMPEFDQLAWVGNLDKAGFSISVGSACCVANALPSHVLLSMDYTEAQARRGLRISSFWNTSESDWRALSLAFGDAWNKLTFENKNIIRV